MRGKLSNILFALFWAGSILSLLFYSSQIKDKNLDLTHKVDSLLIKSESDSIKIKLSERNPDTVKVNTTTTYSFSMQGKEYTIDEYLEVFNRVYTENEYRKDSLRVWKQNLEVYKKNFEELRQRHSKDVDSTNRYLEDLYFYKTKYESLQKYLKSGKILMMKNDTLRVIDDKIYFDQR